MTSGQVDLTRAGIRPFALRVLNQYWPGKRSRRQLDVSKLISKARRATGFQDLGSDFDPEALEILVKSINSEARLSPLGFMIMRMRLQGALALRLRAVQLLKQHPEILETEVAPVWLITGLQRTGTTFLQRVLSEDPGSRALASWESLDPVPHGGREETRTRIRNARMSEKALKWMSPGFFAIHPIRHLQPEEDVLLLDASFHTTAPEAIMHVPTYAQWLEHRGCETGYTWEEKMLKILQWQRPAALWILKSPHHLEFLEEFTKVFSNTKVIWTHRKPVECVPSFLSMVYHGRALFSDSPDIPEIRDHWMRKMKRMVECGMAWSAGVGERDLVNVQYRDLVERTMPTIKGVYRDFDREFSIDFKNILPGVLGNLAKNRKITHSYTAADFQIGEDEIRKNFEQYSLKLKFNNID